MRVGTESNNMDYPRERKEAVLKQKACEALEISLRSYKRWTDAGEFKSDRRPDAEHPEPENKLNPEERQRILDT
jgi:hypothetical protein